MPDTFTSEQRLKLIQTLCALSEAQFEQLCFALKPPAGLLPSNAAAQGLRASALLAWVESPTGCGFSRFLDIFQSFTAGISEDANSITQVMEITHNVTGDRNVVIGQNTGTINIQQ